MDYRRKFANMASKPDAERRLFGIAFLEGMYIPVPSDLLLIPMALLAPERAGRYAIVAAVGSVCGATLGYIAAFVLFQTLAAAATLPVWLLSALAIFKYYSGVFLVSAGFSAVPFNIVTVLSGMAQVNLFMFIGLTMLVRSLRYGLIAWLVWRGGASYQPWLERNFYGTMLVMTLALLVISVIGVLFFETA